MDGRRRLRRPRQPVRHWLRQHRLTDGNSGKVYPGRTSPPGVCRRRAQPTGRARGFSSGSGGWSQGLPLTTAVRTLTRPLPGGWRRRLLRNARASRRTASSASAIAASVITAPAPHRCERRPAVSLRPRPPGPLADPGQVSDGRGLLRARRADAVAARPHPGRGDPRVVGPVSRAEAAIGRRQEDGEQPGPDPGPRPGRWPGAADCGPARAHEASRVSHAADQSWFSWSHPLSPLMRSGEHAEQYQRCAELNKTNSSSRCTNTTAPEMRWLPGSR